MPTACNLVVNRSKDERTRGLCESERRNDDDRLPLFAQRRTGGSLDVAY